MSNKWNLVFSRNTLLVNILLLMFPAIAVFAETLNFKALSQKAVEYSFDLKIASADIDVARYRLDEARADYYPSLALRFGNEYIHAFGDAGSDVVTLGDSVLAGDESSYKHSLTAYLNYNLYDFGARELKQNNARREIEIAQSRSEQALKEVRIELLARFARGLKLNKQRRTTEDILSKRKQIFRCLQNLNEAGTVGRDRVESAALDLAETMASLEDLEIEYQQALNGIASLTGESYLADSVDLGDLAPPMGEQGSPGVEDYPELRMLEDRISNKKADLSIAKRECLPRFLLSGAYRMYGSDRSSYADSITNMDARDATLTLVVEWPLFSGFRDVAVIKRLGVEVRQLELEKEKRKAELQQDLDDTLAAYHQYVEGGDLRQKHKEQIRQNDATLQRLAQQQTENRVMFLEQDIELARRDLMIDLKQVDLMTAAWKLAFLGGENR